MDRFLSTLARVCAYLGCLPRSEIRHMYVWKASAVAYAKRSELTEQMVNEWAFWELRYALAGYRPFPWMLLCIAAEAHESLHDPRWHQLRTPGERAHLHAGRFRQNFLEGASS